MVYSMLWICQCLRFVGLGWTQPGSSASKSEVWLELAEWIQPWSSCIHFRILLIRGKEEVLTMLKPVNSDGEFKLLCIFYTSACITYVNIIFSKHETEGQLAVFIHHKTKASHIVISNSMSWRAKSLHGDGI